jgi:hypothetical protein
LAPPVFTSSEVRALFLDPTVVFAASRAPDLHCSEKVFVMAAISIISIDY